MRQTQILRVHKRRRAAEPLVDVPVTPVVATTEAAAVVDAIDVLLAELLANVG